VTTSIV
jgi:hypothetical protein